MSLVEAYMVDSSSEEYDYDYDDPFEGYYDSDPFEMGHGSDDYSQAEDPKNDEAKVPIFQAQGTHTNQQYCCTIIMKALNLELLNVKWVYFKWVFIVLNVVIEVCQATFTQENALGKISTPFYLKSSVVTSSICVMISLVEAIHEGKENKVAWQKRGYLGWFYYPGTERQRRLFARFALVFGVVSSTVQLCVNLVALVINKSFLQFDMLPLLLSSGYFVAALVDRGGKDMVIKCDVHGRCVAECSKCKVDASV